MNADKVKMLTQTICLSAVAVGSLILCKRTYDTWKLNRVLSEVYKTTDDIYNNYFIIDRIIDADCDGKLLVVGIKGGDNLSNSLSKQGIRWGNTGQIKRLVSFVQLDKDGLVYNFEDDYRLTLTKTTNNKIMYAFEMKDNVVIKEMNEAVMRSWKPISMSSTELDKICELK